MAERIDRSKWRKKVVELREKHRDKETGAYNTDAGSPYDLEFIAWLKDQELEIDYARMSRELNRSYFDSEKAFRDVTSKPSGQLALWEDDALIALSTNEQISIEMKQASKDQWMISMRIQSKKFAQHARAYGIIEDFQGGIFDEWSDDDKIAGDVAERLRRKAASSLLKEAAD